MNSEDTLIKQAVNGNEAAFEELVEKYKAYVFAIVLNFVSDRHQAENIAQEVFLQIYLSLPGYRFEGFKTWIGRIAVHKAIDWKRKQQRVTANERLADVENLNEAIVDCSLMPEDEVIGKDQMDRLRLMCDELPDKYRVVVEKHYFHDKSYQKIAREEGIAVKTVESRLYRARQMLKKQWKEGI